MWLNFVSTAFRKTLVLIVMYFISNITPGISNMKFLKFFWSSRLALRNHSGATQTTKFISTKSVRRIFERGEGRRFGKGDKNQMRKMNTKKGLLSDFRPFFYPDLGKNQKKMSSLKFSLFFCPNSKGGAMAQFCLLF